MDGSGSGPLSGGRNKWSLLYVRSVFVGKFVEIANLDYVRGVQTSVFLLPPVKTVFVDRNHNPEYRVSKCTERFSFAMCDQLTVYCTKHSSKFKL